MKCKRKKCNRIEVEAQVFDMESHNIMKCLLEAEEILREMVQDIRL